jgi:uncharacterized protein (UPF0276 family)
MSDAPLVGIALQPEPVFFEHNRRLLEERAQLFEVTPETLWTNGCEPGPGHQRLLRFTAAAGRPVVGHGVLCSIGAAAPPARRARWLQALCRDAQAFGFGWLSEHLGFADVDGLHVAWPLPLPCTDEAADVVAASLRELRGACGEVLFENNADLFCLGDPLDQAELFARICERADAGLLLDLHNAFAFCRNVGVDLHAFLERLPWPRVRELHLSGGSDSDPELLPSRRSLRLDSHDGAVPDEVWRALQFALPRASGLRAVVCEWFPDAMDAAAGAQFAADFERARAMVEAN